MNNDIFQKLQEKIDAGGIFQPVLFLGENLELLNSQVKNIIFDLFEYYQIDKNNLYVLSDNNEKIKIQLLREFIAKSNIKSSYAFQVFFIENISRATLESFNAALKFLEEPGMGNIVIVTSQSESSIPETVLSRLQTINLFSSIKNKKNDFFYQLIDEYISQKNTNILKYFFQDKKIEKQDYIDFLETFFLYIKEKMVYVELLDQISESLLLIQKNNVLPKYEIDKLFLKM
ncbi:MAG: hypothetical protein AB7E37_04685 [Candidatus Altimarinota bacterium]